LQLEPSRRELEEVVGATRVPYVTSAAAPNCAAIAEPIGIVRRLLEEAAVAVRVLVIVVADRPAERDLARKIGRLLAALDGEATASVGEAHAVGQIDLDGRVPADVRELHRCVSPSVGCGAARSAPCTAR
jgi:hypothetical protein